MEHQVHFPQLPDRARRLCDQLIHACCHGSQPQQTASPPTMILHQCFFPQVALIFFPHSNEAKTTIPEPKLYFNMEGKLQNTRKKQIKLGWDQFRLGFKGKRVGRLEAGRLAPMLVFSPGLIVDCCLEIIKLLPSLYSCAVVSPTTSPYPPPPPAPAHPPLPNPPHPPPPQQWGRYQEQHSAVSAGFSQGPAACLRKFQASLQFRTGTGLRRCHHFGASHTIRRLSRVSLRGLPQRRETSVPFSEGKLLS